MAVEPLTRPREPIFNAPSSVIAAIAVLVSAHVLVWVLLPERQALSLLANLAFIPYRYAHLGESLWETGAAIWSFITHMLLHGDATHLGLNCAWLLVFGGAVAMRIGSTRFLTLSLLSGLAGALVFLLLRFGDPVPMIGASGAVSGLMGGAMRFFFPAIDRGGFDMFRQRPKNIPLATVRESLADRRMQILLAVMVAINVVMALATSSFTSADGIAWQAHLGGFLFGFLCFQFFEPPGRPRLEIVRPTLH